MTATLYGLSTFWDALRIQSLDWGLRTTQEVSGLGDGSVLRADLGPTLWRGSVRLARMHRRDGDLVLARLSELSAPGASFLAYDVMRPGPAGDEDGATLGAAAVTLDAANIGTSRIRLAGLPPGYALAAGDCVAFTYASSPTRHALHRLTESATADGTGVTALATVTPALRTGAQAGDAVTLIKPAAKCVIVPGSIAWGSAERVFQRGVGFDFIQTLR